MIEGLYNGQTPSRFNKDNWNGSINWLSSGELNRSIVVKTVEKISSKGKSVANLKVIPKGTVVIAITGLEAAGTRGNCAKLGIDTTLNQSCMAIFPKREILDSDYLFHWYKKIGESYGIRYTQGTKQQSYNAEIIKILPITLPKIEEQQVIARFLDDVDHQITVQQRKSVSKDEVMNLFLCKSNALVDIDVYANSWEQRRLGECFSESIERTENGDLLSVTIDSGVKRFNELDRKDNSSEDKSNYKKVVVGDLVYNSMRMWQGACGTSAYNGLVSPAYTVLHVKKENIAKFFEYMFKRRESLNSFQKHSQGMTSDTWNLKFPLFSKIKMNLPSGYEQKKISNFFELLDYHITFQQRM